MASDDAFDFWYAVNNTEVIQAPTRHLETFGTTDFTYYLVSELMDSVGRFRVREGRIGAAQPQIITPGDLGTLPLEGFGEAEARRYAEWLARHAGDLHILQYGFRIHKREIQDWLVSDPREQVIDNVRRELQRRNDPASAIVLGVDEPWEVCLVKLMIEVVQQSAPHNVSDLQRTGAPTGNPTGPDDLRRRIDADFLAASRDPELIPELHRNLEAAGLFSDYEDRFFALVRAAERRGGDSA